ncbi:potassium channel family protein [Polycladidibacter stylochi]|uniref:potassium channel family protein n=1 Tax=Polycladidibacter stylochi TaxID=1807766 RepID=UPI00082C652C|nr:potassium channel family protein [Pseudovibrio stylochi]
MPIISKIFLRVYDDLVELKLWLLAALLLSYLGISYILFYLAGEQHLVQDFISFSYFAITTASTVGYGDLSPQTAAGRLIATIWFMPGALIIFTAFLGKVTSDIIRGVRRMADGLGDFAHLNNSVVLIGYQEEHSIAMINDLIASGVNTSAIIMMAREGDISLPKGVRYIRSERLDALQELTRAGVHQASMVIVYCKSDGESFNSCLAVRELNQSVHVAAYFGDQDTARRARQLAQVEAVVSNASSTLIRAAQDPGASQVLHALSSFSCNATIFSLKITRANTPINEIEAHLNAVDASLLAIGDASDKEQLCFRPFPQSLSTNHIVYYVAHSRVKTDRI